MSENTPFDPAPASEEKVAQMEAARQAYKAVYANIMSLPCTRERSVAVTKLEESAMWLNKSITKGEATPAPESRE